MAKPAPSDESLKLSESVLSSSSAVESPYNRLLLRLHASREARPTKPWRTFEGTAQNGRNELLGTSGRGCRREAVGVTGVKEAEVLAVLWSEPWELMRSSGRLLPFDGEEGCPRSRNNSDPLAPVDAKEAPVWDKPLLLLLPPPGLHGGDIMAGRGREGPRGPRPQ